MTQGGKRPLDGFYPELLAPLQALATPARVWVALSGGLDSMVLLHLAHQAFSARPASLRAIHVNHQLQNDAARFETACRKVCERLDVPLDVVPVTVGSHASLETAARDARYTAFEACLGPGDLLLMAHHADDQAETLLFRFLRGSGVRGLAGMPGQRPLGAGTLVRPLLAIPRERLLQQAQTLELDWVEDPSNREQRHDRNFLRHQILPRLRQRWAGLDRRLAATASACDESAQLAELLAREHFHQLADGEDRLALEGVKALQVAARRNLLHWWLADALDRTLSDQELADLVDAPADANPEIRMGAFALRRFQGHIYRVALSPAPEDGEQPLVPGQSLTVGGFTLTLGASGESGAPPRLTVALRRGGERFRPHGAGPLRPLKKWLQESGVPPWERQSLPLVFHGEELVAVADLWSSPEFARGPQQHGWWVEIRRGDVPS